MRYTQSGKAFTGFTLAVNRAYAKKNTNQQQADFIQIVAWDKRAELVGNHLHKGSRIGIEGEIQTRNYTTNSGEKRYVTEVLMTELEFLDAKSNSVNPNNSVPPLQDDDVPF